MALLNNRYTFGSTHKFLHWAIVALVLGAFVASYVAAYGLVRRTPEWMFTNRLHHALGLAVLALALVMAALRLPFQRPKVPHLNRYEAFAASAAHGLLYFFLIALPISGYVGGTRPRDFFGLFTLPSFSTTPLFGWISRTFDVTFAEFERPFDVFHREIAGPWLMWVVLALHVSAAMFHHLHRKDETLIRMLPAPLARRLSGGRTPGGAASAK